MKNCWKYRYMIIGISLILAVVAFFTLGTLAFSVINTLVLIIISTILLISMLVVSTMINHSKEFKEAYCCCGTLITIGAGGTLLVSVLTTSAILSTLITSIAVAIIIFFIGLIIGGFWCFLKVYNQCKTCECKPFY